MTQLISISVTAIFILNIFLAIALIFLRKKGSYLNMGVAPCHIFHTIFWFLHLPFTRKTA